MKKKIQGELGLSDDELELSMGMSGDWELAVQEGSSNIRVGSTIFGLKNEYKYFCIIYIHLYLLGSR